MSISCIPGTILGTEAPAMNKTNGSLSVVELTVKCGEKEISKISSTRDDKILCRKTTKERRQVWRKLIRIEGNT